MKNRTEGEMILAWRQAVPKHEMLENKIWAAYRTKIHDTHMTFELVPPDDHHRKLAERSILTWKDHFAGVLSGTAETSPLQLLC